MPEGTQDSPKVSGPEWPWPAHTIARVLVKLARGPVVPGNYFYAIRFGDEPTDDEETYIPVSALLSDEFMEAAHRGFVKHWTGAEHPNDAVGDEQMDAMRAALQAAIEQVGGAK